MEGLKMTGVAQLPRPLLFDLGEIGKAVRDPQTIIHGQAAGFRAYSLGQVCVPPVQSMGQPPMPAFLAGPEAQTCIKSGYVKGADHFVVKIAPGGVSENEKRGLPTNTGLNLLFSQHTLRLEAILFDEGILTEMRTAAAAALAARLFAPRTVMKVGMFGCGVQARWQLRFLRAVTDCRQALVNSRNTEHAARFCEEMRDEGWEIRMASAHEIASSCQLIHTATPSRTPLLRRDWFTTGVAVHINAMGADVPGKQELEPCLVAAADLLVCDSRAQTFERGEFQEAVSQKLLDATSVLEIGEVLDQPKLHRQGAEDVRLTIFDSSGVAVQDIMITQMVYDALVGQRSHL